MNGFPLMAMMSVQSRCLAGTRLDPEIDGATMFEIENDLEDASGLRPSQGAVASTLSTLMERGFVKRESVPFGKFETYVYFITSSGRAKIDWCMTSLNILAKEKPRNERGPRISGEGRRRPRG
jgi:DNA-binding PadR family transcriptional regulator